MVLSDEPVHHNYYITGMVPGLEYTGIFRKSINGESNVIVRGGPSVAKHLYRKYISKETSVIIHSSTLCSTQHKYDLFLREQHVQIIT